MLSGGVAGAYAAGFIDREDRILNVVEYGGNRGVAIRRFQTDGRAAGCFNRLRGACRRAGFELVVLITDQMNQGIQIGGL